MTKEISCRITRTLILYVREKNSGMLGNLLDGSPLDEDYLSDDNNWVSHGFLQTLYARMIDLLGDENAVYHMTLASGDLRSLGILDRIVRLLGSPKLIYSQAPRYNKFLKLNGSVFIHEISDSRVVLEDRYHNNAQKTRYDCDYTRGILAGIPTMFGLPPAEVEEINCQVAHEKYGHRIWPDAPPQGSEGCIYRINWLPQKIPFLKRFFFRRNYHQQAIEDLVQANTLVQLKYDEVKRLATDLEKRNQQLLASKQALESQKSELIDSKEKYKEIVKHAPAGIFEFDVETSKIISVNEVMCRYTGYTEDELLQMNPSDLLSPESKEQAKKVFENLSSDQVDPAPAEYKIHGKNGRELYVITNTKFSFEGDKAKKAMMVIHDLTAIRKAEQEKKNLEVKLQNAKKLESLGTLAGGVAHDLNNILSGIVGYPDLLLHDLEKDSPLRKPLLAIKKSGEKAGEIVQDLLTLARRNVATKKLLNLNHIIDDFIRSPEYGKILGDRSNIIVETNLSKRILTTVGSETHMSKTVMNLVTNAADAMPSGGQISISTKNSYIDQPYNTGFEVVPEGEYVILEISDMGIGMPQTDLNKIFEPFYTKKSMGRSGTGLGMSVVWGTVKDHEGFIDIITEEGTGTTFILYFPVSRSEMEVSTSIHIEEYLGKGESILIIDDSPEQRDLAKRIMKRLGYDVYTSASGEEAVKQIKERSYDMLIIDMIMPGMDGLETYQQILSMIPDQKAIIASGYAENERVHEAQRLGAGCYLKKPFTIEKIGIAVRSELDRP